MVVESCCIIVILLFIVFVTFFLFTQRRDSIQKYSKQGYYIQSDPPQPPQLDYIPTYRSSNCGLNFVRPEKAQKNLDVQFVRKRSIEVFFAYV